MKKQAAGGREQEGRTHVRRAPSSKPLCTGDRAAPGGRAAEARQHANGEPAQGAADWRNFLKPCSFIALICWPMLFCYYLVMILSAGKYRRSYLYRMGLMLPAQLPFSTNRVWFHALSVGETLSVKPLVKAFKSRYPDLEIIFSTATETGQDIARERLGPYVQRFFYLPHDFPWILDAVVRRLKPDCFVLVETDIWPNLLRVLERQQVGRILVNGRLSPKSVARYRTYRSLFSPFGLFDYIFAQSAKDGEHFVALGAEPDRVHAVGNLKFDSLPAPLSDLEIGHLRKITGIDEEREVWIAGSTHAGEEEILFKVHHLLLRKHRDLLLILAPRRVQRISKLTSVAERFGLSMVTRSSSASCRGKDVYVLDSLGELSRFYALADVAFIGGSLVPFGGHNPLEAVVQGKPCVWGPHLFNFREIGAMLLDAGVAKIAASEEQLLAVVADWLKDVRYREEIELRARRLIESNSGCSERILNLLAH